MQNLTKTAERRLYIRPNTEQKIRGFIYSFTAIAAMFVATILFSY